MKKIKFSQNNSKFGMNVPHTAQVHSESLSSFRPIGKGDVAYLITKP